MPLYMYQLAYTSQSWAAQLKNPQNRIETVARQASEAARGKFVSGWYCFGDYNAVIILDLPDNESMAAVALTVEAGGALRAGKTTALMSGALAVEAMKKTALVSKIYRPAL